MKYEELQKGMDLMHEIQSLRQKLEELQKVKESADEVGFNVEFAAMNEYRNNKSSSVVFVNLKANGASEAEVYRLVGTGNGQFYDRPNESFATIAKTALGMMIEALTQEINKREADMRALGCTCEESAPQTT